jgi:hypothetical protein
MKLGSIEADDAYDRWRTRGPDDADDARERWDEDTAISEAISASDAFDILELLICDPVRAQARLKSALDEAFEAYLEDCRESNAQAEIDAYEASLDY